MRFACAISVMCVLIVSFIEAPFAHVHDQASGEDHHRSELAHVHAHHVTTESSGPAIDRIDPADDERLVNCFQLVRHSGISLYSAPQETEVIEPAPVREFVRATPLVSNHDPPPISNLPARAPPIIPA